MKKMRLVLGLTTLVAFGLISCEKSETITANSVEGTYVGSLTSVDGLKNASIIAGGIDATAEVTDMGNGTMEIHCYGGEMDTTFMLNYYENNDSLMVCLNGEAFADMYGHMMSDSDMMGDGGMMGGNSSGGMMGGNSSSGMMSGNAGWMNHMNNEHSEGDQHFGGFDMTNRTFGYTILSNKGDYRFQGTKK